MNLIKTALLVLLIVCVAEPYLNAQDVQSTNIYTFIYDGRTYEVVRENRNWTDAANDAVASGGFLAEINSQAEQDAVYSEVLNNASINPSFTVAPDGGGASYVWLGANDFAAEGSWVWDGDGDLSGTQFWQGTSITTGGNPVGGLYSNWGNEPDNYLGQHALGLALTNWPLGTAGQWNDVNHTNTLYYVIEYSYLKPVELSLFVAQQRESSIALLWRTETEKNNYGWTVERRFPGNQWVELGFVNGAGTTTQPQSYEFKDNDALKSKVIEYRIKQIDFNGKFTYSPIAKIDYFGVPSTVALYQNFPNPFNPSTNISYSLSTTSLVRLAIYDMFGREVAVLVNGEVSTGLHSVEFISADLPSGTYIYRLESNGVVLTKRMNLLR